MQFAVMLAAANAFGARQVPRPYTGECDPFVAAKAMAEARFSLVKGGVFYADVCLFFRATEGPRKAQGAVHVMALEVKPVIHSAGAVLRQMRALEDQLRAWSRDDNSATRTTEAFAVVRADDPKAQMLADLAQAPILTFDGVDLNFLVPEKKVLK
jgi:hypothetical protein